jgi:hypothetical protein
MSLDSANDLSSFYQFVADQLQSSDGLPSPEDCLTMWRTLNPQPAELLASVEATRIALSDMDAGDTGRLAQQLLNEARAKFASGR